MLVADWRYNRHFLTEHPYCPF